ncbi:MAG: DNA adenine methylase [Bacteroidales bacterium]|jgi:adenine-specific DNA-methyltransferase|nr:DNA adenine methylase [Bacteroidales bacterium]
MTYQIQNRRYIGNKYKLLSFIENTLLQRNVEYRSVCDIFAGTGVVGNYFLSQSKDVIFNDFLYSNFVFYNAWFSFENYDANKVQAYLDYYNHSTEYIVDNYCNQTFSNTYFSEKNAKQLGSIRIHLEKNRNNLNDREFYILLSSLLYTADRIANTVGHFEAFLTKQPQNKEIILKMLDIRKYEAKATIYNQNANELIKEIRCDLLYLDPPYNARQYVNFYHVLENLAEWKQPQVFGKTLKMERENRMSEYSKAKAKDALEDLVLNAHCKYIVLSYNNTYSAKSGATINKITKEEIERILGKVGAVQVFEEKYKFFNSGKTDFGDNHRELLYFVEKK